jgi:hypothetical protein
LTEFQAFHQQLKLYFFEKIYRNQSFKKADYAAIPRFKHQSIGTMNVLTPLLIMAFLTSGFVLLGSLNFKKKGVLKTI